MLQVNLNYINLNFISIKQVKFHHSHQDQNDQISLQLLHELCACACLLKLDKIHDTKQFQNHLYLKLWVDLCKNQIHFTTKYAWIRNIRLVLQFQQFHFSVCLDLWKFMRSMPFLLEKYFYTPTDLQCNLSNYSSFSLLLSAVEPCCYFSLIFNQYHLNLRRRTMDARDIV